MTNPTSDKVRVTTIKGKRLIGGEYNPGDSPYSNMNDEELDYMLDLVDNHGYELRVNGGKQLLLAEIQSRLP